METGGGGGGDIVLKQCGARRPCRWYLVLASTTSIDALAPTLNLHHPSPQSPWLDSRLERMDKEDDTAGINGHLAVGLKLPLESLRGVGDGFHWIFFVKGSFEGEFFLRRIWGYFLIFGMVSLRY